MNHDDGDDLYSTSTATSNSTLNTNNSTSSATTNTASYSVPKLVSPSTNNVEYVDIQLDEAEWNLQINDKGCKKDLLPK